MIYSAGAPITIRCPDKPLRQGRWSSSMYHCIRISIYMKLPRMRNSEGVSEGGTHPNFSTVTEKIVGGTSPFEFKEEFSNTR